MAVPIATRRRPARPALGLLALLLLAGGAGWPLAAQDAAKKKEEVDETKTKKKIVVEEEDAKPKKSAPKEEVEDRAPPKRKVIDVGDEPKAGKKPDKAPARPPAAEVPVDLAAALKSTKHPELQKLYGDLAVAHDLLVMRDSATPLNIEPIKDFYHVERPRFRNGRLDIRTFTSEWRAIGPITRTNDEVQRLIAYEDLVGERVDKFLASNLPRLPEDHKSYLSRAGMLQAAALVLSSAESFHLAALENGKRVGDAWGDVARRLRDRLLRVHLEQIALFAADDNWEGAAELGRDFAERYQNPDDRSEIARVLVGFIVKSLDRGDGDTRYKVARDRLRTVEQLFPNARASKQVANTLEGRAKSLFAEATKLREAKKTKEALELLQLAEDIWPSLPDLRDDLLRLKNAYPILRVGVRELPVSFLPGEAATDVERQVGELIFESLVRLREDAAGTRYEPVLAARLPKLVPLGREFRIAPGAAWSDGQPVTAVDVGATLRLLNNSNWRGSVPGLSQLLADRVELGGDTLRVPMNLKQGYLDPLSLMTFKVLPRNVRDDSFKFNTQKPVGSGPFQYHKTESLGGGPAVARFLANSYYGEREGRSDLPRIREVQLHPTDDPAAALLKDDANRDGIHIAMVSADKAGELRQKGGGAVKVVGPLRTRRVWFLAVNHRRKPFQDNEKLRKALAHALNREKILDECFRGGAGRDVHRALNGPFPAGSWACSPRVKADLYDPDQARALGKEAAEKGGTPPWKLRLKYPDGDPAVAAAMKLVAEQAKEAQFELELLPVEPHKFRQDVEDARDFDLAYYHYDFASEAYWLWPLFDSETVQNAGDRARGTNYLGFLDGTVMAQVQEATVYRNFADVQRSTHVLHQLLHEKMPLIPLWQLDTFIAHRADLRPTALDPLLLFSDVEHWTKEAR